MDTCIKSVNPSSGQLIAEFSADTYDAIARKLEQSELAFQGWRHSRIAERAKLLTFLAAKLRKRSEDLAAHITEEMGKPITQSLAEIEKSAVVCDYYAEHGERILSTRLYPIDDSKGLQRKVYYEALGPIFAIMPWNFPFWQVFRWLAPNLMAGNAGILQHAWNVTGCAQEILSLFQDAPAPEHVLQLVLALPEQSQKIIADKRISGVTVTGSTRVGRIVAKASGSNLKKTVLELGGSDPYLVLSDADLQHAAKVVASSRLNNAGQSCIAAKRIIVVKECISDFTSALVDEMSKAKMGEPMRTDTNLGPLARNDVRVTLHSIVQRSIEQGAKVAIGAQIPSGSSGFFYPPTVLTNVTEDMPCFYEEVFGPVASVIEAKDENDAIRLANTTEYGLGAAVFSRDITRAEHIASKKLDAGNCFVNIAVHSDPIMPFGGIKNSGYGRELSSEGIFEFVNVKSVVVQRG